MISKSQLRKALDIKHYYVKYWDTDKHGYECGCGDCDSLGKSYGVGVFTLDSEEPIDVFYAACEEDALDKAKSNVKHFLKGQLIKPPEEDE